MAINDKLVGQQNKFQRQIADLYKKIRKLTGSDVEPSTPSELEKITEDGNVGWRLLGKNPANYGDIGNDAVDFSHSSSNSSTLGATGQNSFAEGTSNTASGHSSHVEGLNCTASGDASHAEGFMTTSSNIASHAEGSQTSASAPYSHAEGQGGVASGESSHKEGQGNTASGIASHAEGGGNTASGNYSHAEGSNNQSVGQSSHVGGQGNTANTYCETVIGTYSENVAGNPTGLTPTNTIFRIGVGTTNENRKDALKVVRNGQIIFPQIVTMNYADDVAAAAGGILVGGLYHTSGVIKIRLT